jgi:hypothetical protein
LLWSGERRVDGMRSDRVAIVAAMVWWLAGGAGAGATPCDRVLARADFRRAQTEFAQREYRIAHRDALLAAAEFAACSARTDERDRYEAANARLLAGAASLGLRANGAAQSELLQSYRAFSAIANNPSDPADLRSQAAQRRARIVALDPTVAHLAGGYDVSRPRMALAPARPATPAGPLVTVQSMSSWRSVIAQDNGQVDAYIHVRVHLLADRAASVSANAFRITVFSATAGQETPRGLQNQAPSYKKYNAFAPKGTSAFIWVRSVVQDEDLGGMGYVQLNAGDARTVVVTFKVRRDEAASEEDAQRAASTLVYIGPP